MSNSRNTFGNTVTRLPDREEDDDGRRMSPPGLGSPDAARLAPAGLRAFARIASLWGLSIDEQLTLLGAPPRSTFFAWRKTPERANLSRDTLERISNILGIYKALQILFADKLADEWVSLPNTNQIFGGRTPLAHMLGGGLLAMQTTRQLLDARRGGL